MQMTSAGANKWLKNLEDEKEYLLSMEEAGKEYIVAENEEAIIPDYDYEKTSGRIMEIDAKIRKIKHCINCFNTTAVLPDLNMTIDEALVKMAQLNRRLAKLDEMRKKLRKSRRVDPYARNNLIEYVAINYDLDKVNEDYRQLKEEVMNIQLALDICNQTRVFEIEL